MKKYKILPILTDKQYEKFWRLSNRDNHTPEECWLWQGHRTKRGYGVLYINPTQYYAHRISYELRYGRIPEGLEVSHLCGNGHLGCVNPDHLVAETHVENNRRKIEHGTSLSRPGEENPNAKLTWGEVNEIRRLRAEDPEYWTCRRLGSKFNYKSYGNISQIIRNEKWVI